MLLVRILMIKLKNRDMGTKDEKFESEKSIKELDKRIEISKEKYAALAAAAAAAAAAALAAAAAFTAAAAVDAFTAALADL